MAANHVFVSDLSQTVTTAPGSASCHATAANYRRKLYYNSCRGAGKSNTLTFSNGPGIISTGVLIARRQYSRSVQVVLPCRMQMGGDDDNGKERLLPHGLDAAFLPRHVALSMDGNTRWARREGLPVSDAYEAFAGTWMDIVQISALWGISGLTTIFFSTENWGRPQDEVQALLQLFERVMDCACQNLVRFNVQVRAIGDISQLPLSLQHAIETLERRTAQNDGLKLSVAMNYGGRFDLVQACRRIAGNVKDGKLLPCDIDQEMVDKELLTSWMGDVANPDLVIRTGGEQRISNFLLWQCAYSEFLFVDYLWPDMDELKYAKALLSYQKRHRRFGKHDNSC